MSSRPRTLRNDQTSSVSSRHDRDRGGGGSVRGDGRSVVRSVHEVRSTNSGDAHLQQDENSSNEKTSSTGNAGEDDWRIRAWEVFTTIAERGHVSADGMTAFANEMNVECELRHVIRAVRQEGFEGPLGFDQATRLLEVIPAMMYEEGSESDQNEDRHVLKMLPWEYLMHKLRPDDERRKIEEEKQVKLVYCGCTPQQWMLIATGFIFLTVVGAILGLMLGLWIRSDNMMFEETIDVSARVASRYIDIATDISRDGLTEALKDFVTLTTHAVETDTRTQLHILEGKGFNRLIIDVPMVEGTFNATVEGRTAEMKGRAAAIGDLTDGVTTLDPILQASIVATLHGWVMGESYHYFMVDATDMSIVLGSSVAATVFQPSVCWPRLVNGESGFIESGRGVHGDADTRVVYVTTSSVKLCMSLAKRSMIRKSRAAIVSLIDAANAATVSSNDTPRQPWLETVIAYRDPDYNDNAMSIRTTKRYSDSYCELFASPSGDGAKSSQEACASFYRLLEQCRVTKCAWQNYTTYYYNGETAIISMTYEPLSDVVLAAGQSYDWMIQISRSSYIDGVAGINAMGFLHVDISLATITKNFDLIPQINPPLYVCPTGAACKWLPSALSTVRESFRSVGSQVNVCPNYVFDPVINSARMLFFNDSVVVQSSIQDSQMKLASALGGGFDTANDRLPEALEMQVYKKKDSTFTRKFDATGTCPSGATCEYDTVLGIVEVSTCDGCRRHYPSKSSDALTFVTTPKNCHGGSGCSKDEPRFDVDLFETDESNPDTVELISGTDYHGKSAIGAISYVDSVDAFVGIYADKGVLTKFRTQIFTIFSVVIVVAVIIAVIGLVFFTRHTLKKVENEWFIYKASIEGEKQKFNTMFQEIVPPKVLIKYHRGQKIIAEQHNMLSIAFVDVCAFAERQKSMSAKEVVRTIAYHFEVYATVAAKFKLFRLKTFGDSTCVVGGIGSKEPASAIAFSVASFAGYVAQMLSPLFSHYPQLLPKLAEAYKNDPNPERPRQVFQIRIGLHAGAATASMVDYGRTPSFDLLGPSLSLARRMQVTAAPGRINCSTAFKEQLEMGDFAGQFEFDSIKKLVAKGQGTVSTYPIRSMSIPIDELILQRLHIEYAHGMFDFRPLAAQCKGAGKSNGSSSAPSNKTGDSASIHDSMMASTNPPGPDDRHY